MCQFVDSSMSRDQSEYIVPTRQFQSGSGNNINNLQIFHHWQYNWTTKFMWKDCFRFQCATVEDRFTAQGEGFAKGMLWGWSNNQQALYLLLLCLIAFQCLLASKEAILHWQIVRRMDYAAWSCVTWFVYVLEASSFTAANIRDRGLVVLHNWLCNASWLSPWWSRICCYHDERHT